MEDLSVDDIVDLFHQKSNTVKRACSRKFLKSYKNTKGQWRIKLEDAEKYFNDPDPHKWIAYSVAIKQFGITRTRLNNLRYTGEVPGIKHKGKWYADMEKLSPFLAEMKEKQSNTALNTLQKSITLTIKNSKGIHLRPTNVICTICTKFLKTTKLFLLYGGTTWEYSLAKGVGKLLEMEIHCGSKVVFKAEGIHCSDVLSEIRREVTSKFSVKN